MPSTSTSSPSAAGSHPPPDGASSTVLKERPPSQAIKVSLDESCIPGRTVVRRHPHDNRAAIGGHTTRRAASPGGHRLRQDHHNRCPVANSGYLLCFSVFIGDPARSRRRWPHPPQHHGLRGSEEHAIQRAGQHEPARLAQKEVPTKPPKAIGHQRNQKAGRRTSRTSHWQAAASVRFPGRHPTLRTRLPVPISSTYTFVRTASPKR